MLNLIITCPFCGKEHSVEVEESAFDAWQNGELIQRAMPNLAPTEREQLISHICLACQVSILGE